MMKAGDHFLKKPFWDNLYELNSSGSRHIAITQSYIEVVLNGANRGIFMHKDLEIILTRDYQVM